MTLSSVPGRRGASWTRCALAALSSIDSSPHRYLVLRRYLDFGWMLHFGQVRPRRESALHLTMRLPCAPSSAIVVVTFIHYRRIGCHLRARMIIAPGGGCCSLPGAKNLVVTFFCIYRHLPVIYHFLVRWLIVL